jgi:hypothetical protein
MISAFLAAWSDMAVDSFVETAGEYLQSPTGVNPVPVVVVGATESVRR